MSRIPRVGHDTCPNIYAAQVSGTRVCRVRGHEYPIRLEASPKFVGNVGLRAAIIYINFFLNILKKIKLKNT